MSDMSIVSIDLMEYEKGALRIDGSIHCDIPEEQFLIRVNGASVDFQYESRYAQTGQGDTVEKDRRAFFLELPADHLEKRNEIRFVLGKEGTGEQEMTVLADCYQARLHSSLKNTYWCFADHMVTWSKDSGLLICRAGKAARIKQELKLLKEIGTASCGSRKMFAIRCLYWLAFPFYSRKNIWITFDKLYKGGDCGEYFYRYMADRNLRRGRNAAGGNISENTGDSTHVAAGKPDGICPVYVLKKDAPDFERLKREGYHPSVYRSMGQRLSYLYAGMVFGTHSGVNSFCGFNNWEIRFVQDRLRAVNTCIQHGLSVQDLRVDSNRVVNNNKRYYCASHCEVENLSKPEYGYGKDVLKLTGIPRYDGLVNRDRRQILISPTWRSYIAMPSVMGSARPYNPEFKHTDYYKIYESLVKNQRLAQTAKDTGYQVIYLLHPVISAQREDFCPGEGIRVVSALDTDYEKILTESSLMVTDYSGIQFDFAYMRKPVVYYHPPALPPHYGDGGFSYDTQGFGEICTGEEELVELLCAYMQEGCTLKDCYRARQDDFFAWDDRENCRRIYEDALGYQRQRQN